MFLKKKKDIDIYINEITEAMEILDSSLSTSTRQWPPIRWGVCARRDARLFGAVSIATLSAAHRPRRDAMRCYHRAALTAALSFNKE